ncbi:hypothetical protein ACFFJ7_04230 [Pseudochelatococcus lubricantis]|jgi:hypothetical protein|uniref:hypothetical protein n=1 Tax=Pseudochelatococcus TaxID=1654719 RepID=UPI0035E98916
MSDAPKSKLLLILACSATILDDLLLVSEADLDRLRSRIERQEAAIEVLRRKYGVNEERPQHSDW